MSVRNVCLSFFNHDIIRQNTGLSSFHVKSLVFCMESGAVAVRRVTGRVAVRHCVVLNPRFNHWKIVSNLFARNIFRGYLAQWVKPSEIKL